MIIILDKAQYNWIIQTWFGSSPNSARGINPLIALALISMDHFWSLYLDSQEVITTIWEKYSCGDIFSHLVISMLVSHF